MNSVRQQKKDLREKVLDLRQQIPEDDWAQKTRSITDKFLQTDFYQKADTIHTYISMNQRKEVGTDELIQNFLKVKKKLWYQ